MTGTVTSVTISMSRQDCTKRFCLPTKSRYVSSKHCAWCLWRDADTYRLFVVFGANMNIETIVTEEATTTWAGGIDGISSKQYRDIYRGLDHPFDWDVDNGKLTADVRNAIRAAAGLPSTPRTIAEMNHAQRESPKPPREPKPRRILARTKRTIARAKRTGKVRIAPFVPKPKRARALHATVREFVYRRDGGRCFYCHCDIADGDGHLDHVFPASRGGKANCTNLVLSCSKCNIHKHASILENLDDVLSEVARRNREFFG